jgi:hypothetical protein
MESGMVVATNFGDRNTAVSMVPLGDGRWAGTSVPMNAGDFARLTIRVQAQMPAQNIAGKHPEEWDSAIMIP